MKLTETDISKATYLAGESRRSDGNNLYFLISENGAKSFQRKHEIPFEPGVWIAMGRYPEDLTLKEARDLNQALKKLLAAQYSVENIVSALTRNTTPDGVRRMVLGSKKTAKKSYGDITFQQMHEAWHSKVSPEWKDAALRQQAMGNIVQYCYPRIGDMPVAKITQPDIIKTLTPIWSAKKDTASDIKKWLSNIFQMAATPDYKLIRLNPADFTEDLLDPVSRPPPDPVLVTGFQALPELWAALTKASHKSPLSIGAGKLLLLTAQHGPQVAAMRWRDLDVEAGTWWVSDLTTVGKSPIYRLPLSVAAQAVLLELYERTGRTEFVFPSLKTATGHILAEHPDKTLQALSEGGLPLAHTPHDLLTAWAAQTGYAPELFFARGLEAAGGAFETKKTQRMFAGLRVIVQHWADYLVGAAVRDEKNRI